MKNKIGLLFAIAVSIILFATQYIFMANQNKEGWSQLEVSLFAYFLPFFTSLIMGTVFYILFTWLDSKYLE